MPGVAGIVQDGILPGFFGYDDRPSQRGRSRLRGWWNMFDLSHGDLEQKERCMPARFAVSALDWLNSAARH